MLTILPDRATPPSPPAPPSPPSPPSPRPHPRLTPPETVSPFDCRQAKLSARYFECGKCGKRFVEAAVVTGDLEFDPVDQLHFRGRKMWCDHCRHIMYWQQVCWADGRLRGLWKSEPGYIRDRRKITEFLKGHPEAAGVES